MLRDGAILCRGAEDVLSELFPSVGKPRPVPDAAAAANLSPEARAILAALSREAAVSAEDLVMATDLPAATVLAGLFEPAVSFDFPD